VTKGKNAEAQCLKSGSIVWNGTPHLTSAVVAWCLESGRTRKIDFEKILKLKTD